MSDEARRALRNFWDSKALDRVEQMRGKGFSPMNALYEEACWRFIEPLLPASGARVLEAGCGTGRWVFRLAEAGHRTTLTDFSPEMVRVAREQVRERGVADSVDACLVMDICDMGELPDAHFDLVLALGEPLGLCGDAGRALNEMRRVTRPGGFVACDVANRFRRALDLAQKGDWPRSKEMADTGRASFKAGFPLRAFTPDEIRSLYESNGLTVTTLAATCPFLSFPPDQNQLRALYQDPEAFTIAQSLFHDHAETPEMLAVSTRLLVVGEKN
ncbi:class I SAM-dependent methyltransferase [Desulfocurvus sp. DL9XJH121]